MSYFLENAFETPWIQGRFVQVSKSNKPLRTLTFKIFNALQFRFSQ